MGNIQPTNERQVRPLTKLEPKQQRQLDPVDWRTEPNFANRTFRRRHLCDALIIDESRP